MEQVQKESPNGHCLFVRLKIKQKMKEFLTIPFIFYYILKNMSKPGRKITIVYCEICKCDVKYFTRHLRLKHKDITEKDYYEKFIRKSETEGFCKTCGKPLKLNGWQGYGIYCNASCEMKDKEVQNKIREAYKDKTGYEHNFSNPEVIKKIRETNIRLYGGIGFASKELKQKALESFNKEHDSDIKDFCQVAHTEEIEKRRIETRLKNNDGKYFSEQAISNIVKSINTEEANIKRVKNRIKNYPNYYPDEYFKRLQENSLKTYAWAKMKLFKPHDKGDCICHCDLCNSDYEINLNTLRTRYWSNKVLCTKCNPLYSECANNFTYSKKEKQVLEEVKKIYNGTILENDRSALGIRELDIYLPDLHIGIEFNGDYWHANPLYYKETDIVYEGKTAQEIWNRDLFKKHLCEEKHIKLITVFETDWEQNQTEVINNIKQFIGY